MAARCLGELQQNRRCPGWRGATASGALESDEKALAIAKRLAAQDPGNTEWQRDVSVSYNKIGDVRLEGGDRKGTLEA